MITGTQQFSDLLSNVLKVDLFPYDQEIKVEKNNIVYTVETFNSSWDSIPFEKKINLDTFAHKCKEWSFDNGYSLVSGYDTFSHAGKYGFCDIEGVGFDFKKTVVKIPTYEDNTVYTEQEAVIEAAGLVYEYINA